MFKIISRKKYNKIMQDNADLTKRLSYAEMKLGKKISGFEVYEWMEFKMRKNMAKKIDDDLLNAFRD